MAISRRQFLKRGAAAAATTALSPYLRVLPGTNVSYAAGPSDAIVVLVQLNGGNDGINTVYPLFGPQRTLYQGFRPTLMLPDTVGGLGSWSAEGFDTSSGILDLGVNDDGTTYALHPVMGAMHALYQQGKLAIVNGVHYPFANHSHFRSEDIWYSLDPTGAGSGGWFGRYLDYAGFGATALPSVHMGSSINPMFVPAATSVFAFRKLSELAFPADGESTFKKAVVEGLYSESALRDSGLYPELVSMGGTGAATISSMEDYYLPGNGLTKAGKVEALLLDANGKYRRNNPLVYSSPLNPEDNPEIAFGGGLARDLRHVAAAIRADVGARFFHVQTGGFDTHSGQEQGFFHSYLLKKVSESVAAFYNDMAQTAGLPPGYSGYRTQSLVDNVVVITFSEFGRTIRQNALDVSSAGTDHGTSAPQFVLGGNTLGGQFGVYPQLDNPGVRNEDDLRMTYDFRDFYGTILSRWLSVPEVDLGPGAGKLLPATSGADADGESYTAFNPIGFLAP
ncbi:MAG: DUF1501 domain-containing protein [Candidatus Binatia bacterium]